MMSMFRWDLTEVIDCLEVLPEVEHYETKHRFEVIDQGIRLVLEVCQLDGDVSVAMYVDGRDVPLVECTILESDAARRVADSRGDYLEFGAGILFGGRYNGRDSIPYGLRVFRRPAIRVEFFGGR